MPNGKRITKEFGNDDKVQLVYDYVRIQDDKGFENEENNFDVIGTGFPPKVLKQTDFIKDYFGDSDQEALTVKEIFE